MSHHTLTELTRTSLPVGTDPAPLVVDGLSVGFGPRQVLTDLDLVVAPGHRTALVGENGSGKSTLLRALAGRLPARAQAVGRLSVPADLAFLGQEPAFEDDHTVAAVLAATLRPLRDLVAEVERLAAHLDDPVLADRYAGVLDRAVALDAWDVEHRARIAAARLGLEHLDPARSIGSLSGGQRTRLALAALMTTRPGALLLDEPTNHLDDDAIAVLSEFLVSLPGVVLLASHDRVLLDEVCTDLVDLEPGELGTDGQGGRRFTGGWSEYEAWRADSRRRWEQTYAAQQDELSRLRVASKVGEQDVAAGRGPRDNDKFIHAFKGARVQQSVARRRKDAERRLHDAEASQVRKPRPPLRFSGDLGAGSGAGRVVQIRDLIVTGRMSLPRLDVEAGEQLLVTGPNGVGKSTLLGVLSGRIAPTEGRVSVTARRVAELTQDVELPLDSTPAELYAAATAALDSVPELPSLGLVHPRDLNRPNGLLSVGQRRRLGLALILADTPDLLLLDELTNHLSLALVGELEAALELSPATIVLASHDRWLRRRWSGSELPLS